VSSRQPTWRRVFDRAERTIGRPLESLVANPRFVDVALFRQQARRAVGGALQRPAEMVLHLLNLPARGDIRRLSHQVAALANEVREVAAGVEELRNPAAASNDRATSNRASANTSPREPGDA
jgi:hypothetical protein